MKVKEIMHGGVTWVSPNTPIPEIAKKMQTDDVGSIPVGENVRRRHARGIRTSRMSC